MQQIPAIDLALAKLDSRIARALGKRERLEDERRILDRKLDRLSRYLRELGRRRSYVANFTLDL